MPQGRPLNTGVTELYFRLRTRDFICLRGGSSCREKDRDYNVKIVLNNVIYRNLCNVSKYSRHLFGYHLYSIGGQTYR